MTEKEVGNGLQADAGPEVGPLTENWKGAGLGGRPFLMLSWIALADGSGYHPNWCQRRMDSGREGPASSPAGRVPKKAWARARPLSSWASSQSP
jgi:hypothetical protein